jgi:hypothetical protein
MVITLGSDLEAALTSLARKRGVAPETLAVSVLREHFLAAVLPSEPTDEWERRLRSAATDCGISLSDEAVSSEGLYE